MDPMNKDQALAMVISRRCPFIGQDCPDEAVRVFVVYGDEIENVCRKCVEIHYPDEKHGGAALESSEDEKAMQEKYSA